MSTLMRALANTHGVARGRDLQRYGFSRVALSTAVHRGEILRLRAGVFATAGADPQLIVAATHGGALTCARALRLHGVWVLQDDESAHVWLGNRGRQHPHAQCRCRAHFTQGTMRLGLTPLETALIHTYTCRGEESFFTALESARHQRKIGRAGCERIRRALPRPARWLVDFARDDAESGLESLIRLRLHHLGISVATQLSISGVGRVDIVIGAFLIIEADGRDNHERVLHRHRDLQRDAAAAQLGYRTLRFDYAMIVHDWATVEAAIFGALASA